MLMGHSLYELHQLARFAGATVKEHTGVGHRPGHHWQGQGGVAYGGEALTQLALSELLNSGEQSRVLACPA